LHLQEATARTEIDPIMLANALATLEAAWADPASFREFCRRLLGDQRAVTTSPFAQWFLQPAETRAWPELLLQEGFGSSLSPDWAWQDALGDCSFTPENGLLLHAANGRDLWERNLSAPRLLRPMSGPCAIQTVCTPVAAERPAIGGLLLWKDPGNFLRLDRGSGGEHEISFHGCLESQPVVIGRGRLPSERIVLRLEQHADRVHALCSADAQGWFTVGHAAFPPSDPVAVGLHAIGNVNRTIYCGAHPDGTAIRFETFQIWR
jgi:hypothetical protein